MSNKHEHTLVELDDAINQTNNMHITGEDTMIELRNQKNRMIKMTGDVEDVELNVKQSGSVLTKIRCNIIKERYTMIAIIILLSIIIAMLLLFRIGAFDKPK